MNKQKTGRWLVIRLADAATSDLLSHLEEATNFVHECINEGHKVAIHSLEGVSRAASLLIAYFVRYHSLNLREAFDRVNKKRSDIRVNRGFWRQLHAYEMYVKGKNSIEESDLPGAIIFEADAMADIIAKFRKVHPRSLVANPSPRKSFAALKGKELNLTGGAFCGSPRKSKQPHTPKISALNGDTSEAALKSFALDGNDEVSSDSPLKKQRV